MLIRRKAQKGSKPIMPESFKREGDEVEAKALETLKNHGDLNQPDKNGDTLLIKLIRYGREETALKMIRAGADVNAKSMLGDAALHEACSCGANEEIIEELIAHGANVDERNYYLWTPLMTAVYCGNEKAVEILLKHNADITLINEELNKASDVCALYRPRNFRIKQMLKEADVEWRAASLKKKNGEKKKTPKAEKAPKAPIVPERGR